jgi:3-deoxy-manno-octulosonate cytidylyltransferase (CMP-KDO synthetase)
MRHIGLYAYRVGFLRRYVTWPSCALEEIESLEQLRALWHGETIYVDEAVTTPGHGVDTESDLVAVEEVMGRKVKT